MWEDASCRNRSADRALTIFAILFGLLALSNFLKPLQFGGEQTGSFSSARLSGGIANTIIGPLFGIFLAVYTYGIWTMRRFALAMGHAYADLRGPQPDALPHRTIRTRARAKCSAASYSTAIAIGVSLGAAMVLTHRKAELS